MSLIGAAQVPASREQILLAEIDKRSLGLEIGPSHCPVAAKRDGFNVRVLDHLDTAGLREKYADHGVDVAAIEEVDYVWSGEPLEELVGDERFAWIIASHVIEHVPDLVGFLNSCERILAPGGVLSLAIPDKRYCFDCERENSALGRVIDVALARPRNHSPGTAAEYFLKVRRKGGLIAWGEGHTGDVEPVHGLADAVHAMAEIRHGRYYDLHGWVFTPDSFRAIIRDLRDLGLIGLEERRFHPTRGHEFFVALGRSPNPSSGPQPVPTPTTPPGILDAYCMEPPGPQQVLDIFRGEWSSAMPKDTGLRTEPGRAGLFTDARVTWAISQAGGVRGRRILEIGPLEGAHSAMLEQAGAAEVVAVEANTRSFLKCLCVKEVFGLRAVRFLLGDGMAFMAQHPGGFDMVFASGILYHLQDPMAFLRMLPRMAPRMLLWTHYFDEDIVRNAPALAHKFGPLEHAEIDGFPYEFVEQSYKEALEWAGFCGGSAPTSRWLTRRSILDFLRHLGYRRIETSFDAPEHPHGPAFAVYADTSGSG